MPLASGTRLGPYEILSAIGAGGMGEVYRARDTRLDRTVAVKVLPASLAGDPGFRERFEREARTISSLEHPHICALYDVGRVRPEGPEGGRVEVDFLVMPYLDGETLAAHLARGALPLDQVLRHAAEIADALDRAHRAGIVHRDLKPGNIMLTKTGARLLDFGLAKPGAGALIGGGATTLATSPAHLTAQGTILGTVPYMAPEQLEGREADSRTDIFAFGAVLYEMATGRPAFAGATPASLIGAIMGSHPAPASSVRAGVSPALDFVIATCLAKDPDERFQSAHDLKHQLRWMAAGSQASGAAPAVTARRRPWSAALLVGALAIVAAGLAVPATRHLLETPSAPAPVRFTVTPPEGAVVFDTPVLSPDGRQLAFTALDATLTAQLWVRPLGSLDPVRVPGTEGAQYPFWSPDGRSLGFFSAGKLRRVELAGGAPQPLADAPTARGGTWSRDGVIVFEATNIGPLLQVPAGGGVATPVSTLAEGEASHRFPHFLPDGRHFLYFSVAKKAEDHAVYIGALDSPARVRVLERAEGEAHYASGHLLFTRNTILTAQPFDAARRVLAGDPVTIAPGVMAGSNTGSFAFSASQGGALAYRSGTRAFESSLRWFGRDGRLLGDLGPPGMYTMPNLSPDGRQAAVTMADKAGNFDLWVIDLAREVRRRVTSDPVIEALGIWSPDGRTLAFYSEAAGPAGNLYRTPAGGAGPVEPLLETPTPVYPGSWSPDGRELVYVLATAAGSTALWRLPLTGEPTPSLYLEAAWSHGQPVFSPDGRWVAYTSDETGRSEVFVQSYPTPGEKVQISTAGGMQARWRRDGRELFYLSLDYTLHAVSMAPGATVEPGRPVALFKTGLGLNPIGFGVHEYDVTADGQRFLVNVPDVSEAPPPVILLDWPSTVRR
jgi:eukaryotic-like serine/threonine-protein kinase